jgi:hypothetical protein
MVPPLRSLGLCGGFLGRIAKDAEIAEKAITYRRNLAKRTRI